MFFLDVCGRCFQWDFTVITGYFDGLFDWTAIEFDGGYWLRLYHIFMISCSP